MIRHQLFKKFHGCNVVAGSHLASSSRANGRFRQSLLVSKGAPRIFFTRPMFYPLNWLKDPLGEENWKKI